MGSNSEAIGSSNIGFQMLKKCGWKEGTGLGVSEQGRLEPLEPQMKKNKLGLGAEPAKQRAPLSSDESKPSKRRSLKDPFSDPKNEDASSRPKKKMKMISKRLKKTLEAEKRMDEKEFERAFFREFWPENQTLEVDEVLGENPKLYIKGRKIAAERCSRQAPPSKGRGGGREDQDSSI